MMVITSFLPSQLASYNACLRMRWKTRSDIRP